jgi:hypothetical protein
MLLYVICEDKMPYGIDYDLKSVKRRLLEMASYYLVDVDFLKKPNP